MSWPLISFRPARREAGLAATMRFCVYAHPRVEGRISFRVFVMPIGDRQARSVQSVLRDSVRIGLPEKLKRKVGEAEELLAPRRAALRARHLSKRSVTHESSWARSASVPAGAPAAQASAMHALTVVTES